MLASAIAGKIHSALEGRGTDTRIQESAGVYGPTFRDDLVAWFEVHGRKFPWRQEIMSPWQFLLVEMCLHRTRAEQVARVIRQLTDIGDTPESFLSNSKKLEPLVSTLGLHWRTENLAAAASYIIGNFNGRVPDRWPELIAIPGVGDYIASAMQCFAFGRSSVLMDTNTQRIARRVLGETDTNQPPWKIRLHLRDLAGKEGPDAQWNQALLDLGTLVVQHH